MVRLEDLKFCKNFCGGKHGDSLGFTTFPIPKLINIGNIEL